MERNLVPLLLAFCCLFPWVVRAQQPVTFTIQQKKISPTQVDVIFQGRIADGWHVYSTNLPAGGPVSSALRVEKSSDCKAVGALRFHGQEINNYDAAFGMPLRYFEKQVTFTQRFQFTKPEGNAKGYLEYATCNDRMCMPPATVEFEVKGPGQPPSTTPQSATASSAKATSALSAATMQALTAEGTTATVVADDSLAKPISADVENSSATDTSALAPSMLWLPVTDQLKALDATAATPFNKSATTGQSNWWTLFLMGFAGGLLALFTPCVWPVIPMTVSFFLKRSKNRRKGIRDAITYGLSIIAIFLLLGAAVTAWSRPELLNSMATNAWFNLFFFLMLLVFAFSLFGWFELTLPSKWADGVDTKATTTGGLISIFLMAFTLVLVSFSCTAPIVGWLLVEAVTTGSRLGLLMGMLGFALALALPFTLFALFPSWLKQAPKSGSWMNTIKICLGFLELAFALKFFSVADLAYGWNLLSRDTFFVLWIAIFLLMGLYLIGVYRFQSDGDDRKAMPVPCILLGLLSIAFAIYMVPGLWGAPCKAVSAFAPPMYTQTFNLNKNEVTAAYTNYEEGMAEARRQGKPVLLDFTGYGCVNCRKMEATVWTDPRVAERLSRNYVLISLYVDDKQPLPQPVQVKGADGKPKTLRTVGDKWAYLEQYKFGYLAQPFYVALDNNGYPLTAPYAYRENVDDYLKFLEEGLNRYKPATP